MHPGHAGAWHRGICERQRARDILGSPSTEPSRVLTSDLPGRAVPLHCEGRLWHGGGDAGAVARGSARNSIARAWRPVVVACLVFCAPANAPSACAGLKARHLTASSTTRASDASLLRSTLRCTTSRARFMNACSLSWSTEDRGASARALCVGRAAMGHAPTLCAPPVVRPPGGFLPNRAATCNRAGGGTAQLLAAGEPLLRRLAGAPSVLDMSRARVPTCCRACRSNTHLNPEAHKRRLREATAALAARGRRAAESRRCAAVGCKTLVRAGQASTPIGQHPHQQQNLG